MNRNYHHVELLEAAKNLRHYSYEEIEYVDLDPDRVLIRVTSYNHPTRIYLVDVWSYTFGNLEDLAWTSVEDV